jgi:RNA polymerase sigma factor (sigma-70 family)
MTVPEFDPADRRAGWFADLYAEHLPAVLSYAMRRCATREDATDLASEVFLVAWRRSDEVPQAEGRLWLFGTARLVLSNQQRADRRRNRLGAALLDQVQLASAHAPDPAREVESDEDRRALLAALDAVSDTDRELLLLVAADGLSPSDAAAVLGLSAGTIRVRLHRARARVRHALARIEAQSNEPQSAQYPPPSYVQELT